MTDRPEPAARAFGIAAFADRAEQDLAGLLDQGRGLLDQGRGLLDRLDTRPPPVVLGGRLCADVHVAVIVLAAAADAVLHLQHTLQDVALALLAPD